MAQQTRTGIDVPAIELTPASSGPILLEVGARTRPSLRTSNLFPSQAGGFSVGQAVGYYAGLKFMIARNEAVAARRRVVLRVLDDNGAPVSGLTFSHAAGEVAVTQGGSAFVEAANNGVETGNGFYYYEFSQAETNYDVSFIGVRFTKTGYTTVAAFADIDLIQTLVAGLPTAAAIVTAVLDAARSGHITLGSIGEGIALSASLLQGNFYIDNVTPTDNGPTAQRLRCWLSASAMAGVTAGGSGQGEFATFLVATTYSGPGKIVTHKVVQQ